MMARADGRLVSWSLLAFVAVSSACRAAGGVSVTPVAPGHDGCVYGGVLVKGDGPGQVICNGAPGGDTVATAALPAGDAHCPFGGVRIDVTSGGATTSQYVCNGAGERLLVRTTQVPPGDVHCAAGGVRIDFARDVANSNVFDPAQIVSTQYLCSVGATGGGGAAALTPPLTPLGAFTITTSGGAATSGAGGWGGALTVKQLAGTAGGHVKLFRTGLADGATTLPAVPPTELGTVPFTAAGNVTVAAVDALGPTTCGALAAGAYFTVGTGTGPIYHCLAGGGTETVTGLAVAAGATLTFASHACPASGSAAASACALLTVAGGCRNEGTITVDLSGGGGQPALLALACGDFHGASGSAFALGGGPGGGGGGTLRLATSSGSLWNQGGVEVSGSDAGGGPAGGAGGAISLSGGFGVFSSGTLAARGGAATAAGSHGGAGGRIALSSASGALHVQGTLDASGGGGGAVGGAGGPITLDVAVQGDLRGTPAIRSDGGDAAATCASGCAGGTGGAISLRVTNGALVSSGPVSSRGGQGAAGPGGTGGTQGFAVQTGTTGGGSPVATGSLWLSGNLDSRGGDGDGGGGDGGAITVSLDPGSAPAMQELVLFGYTRVDTHGGAGGTSGGRGGGVLLASAPSAGGGGPGPGGGVVSWADVLASGGAATAGPGGPAGGVTLRTQAVEATSGAVEPALNAGALTLLGGAGTILGGAGGTVVIHGRTGARSEGSIDGSGGVASSGQAGTAGSCSVFSDAGEASLAPGGTVRADGGASTGAGATLVGGPGGYLEVRGVTATVAAGLSARGGDGSGGAGGGGAGGLVLLAGTAQPAAVTASTIDVRGGTAATPGARGTVVIDGRIVTSQWTP